MGRIYFWQNWSVLWDRIGYILSCVAFLYSWHAINNKFTLFNSKWLCQYRRLTTKCPVFNCNTHPNPPTQLAILHLHLTYTNIHTMTKTQIVSILSLLVGTLHCKNLLTILRRKGGSLIASKCLCWSKWTLYIITYLAEFLMSFRTLKNWPDDTRAQHVREYLCECEVLWLQNGFVTDSKCLLFVNTFQTLCMFLLSVKDFVDYNVPPLHMERLLWLITSFQGVFQKLHSSCKSMFGV